MLWVTGTQVYRKKLTIVEMSSVKLRKKTPEKLDILPIFLRYSLRYFCQMEKKRGIFFCDCDMEKIHAINFFINCITSHQHCIQGFVENWLATQGDFVGDRASAIQIFWATVHRLFRFSGRQCIGFSDFVGDTQIAYIFSGRHTKSPFCSWATRVNP